MSLSLIQLLQRIRPTGPEGFEGLIAALLQALTGAHFHLASGGYQAGRDMSARQRDANVIAVECKRYGTDTELNERELLGELVRVDLAVPDLDLWVLVTSHEVDSTLTETLRAAADQNGIAFFAVSSGDGEPSSLEILCANSPSVVANHPGIAQLTTPNEIQLALNKVANHPNFNSRLLSLKHEFASPLVGYENWRTLQNQHFLKTLKSAGEARAAFGQPINFEESGVMLVERQHLWASLDQWQNDWRTQHMFATLGHEGDGKTWGITSWIAEQIKRPNGFPGVIFVSSGDIFESEFTANDLRSFFARRISPWLPDVSSQQTIRRFSRWLSRIDDHPLILLVLDGINERHSSQLWRGLFETLAAEPWASQVRVLVSCRTNFWRHNFQRLRYLGTTVFTLEPYDDDELNTALSHHKLKREDISNTVLPLIRKPRYFDLMTKHHTRMAESGDVTPARLIYEDWRDRYERKRSMILTDEDFQNVIRDLALAHQSRGIELSSSELANVLPPLSNNYEILKELQTGGIIRSHKNKFIVDEKQLTFGLGLLLVDQLEAADAPEEDPRETIASWLEPQADMDIKAAICEFAVLQALSSETISLRTKRALLEAWILNHNPTSTTESNLTAYIPVCPEAYVALAEAVWSDNFDNRWVQEALTRAFVATYDFDVVSSVLLPTFERWLGFVLAHGSPFLRDKNEELEKRKEEIEERLGRKLELGPINLADYQLTVIDDDGLIRLGRVALAVISHLPRREFVKCFVIGCLAEVIAGSPDKYDVIAWCIRTSEQSLWPALEQEIRTLTAVQSEVTQRVARRLLAFEGSSEAYNLQQTIPNKGVSNPLLQQHLKDPCSSGFAWSAEDCVTCLQREDLPPAWIARHFEPYACNPKLNVSDSLRFQFRSLTEQIDLDEMWVVLGTTSADHTFKTYEPTLARFAPGAAAALIRLVAGRIKDREGMARRQLILRLEEHYLVLEREQQNFLRGTWEQIIAHQDSWTEAEDVSEMVLFQILLTQMNSDEQLANLIRRPSRAADLFSYKESFHAVFNWDQVRNALIDPDNDVALYRTLWFVSAHANNIPIAILEDHILPLFDHENELVRSKVLRLIFETGNRKGIQTTKEKWRWNVSFHGYQNHWGSLILAKYGTELTFDQLVRRIHPSYLGYAVQVRGSRKLEVLSYGQFLDQLLTRLSNQQVEIPDDLPPFNIESKANAEIVDVSLRTLPAELFNRSITFLSPYFDRGGLLQEGQPDLEEWNTTTFEEYERELSKSVSEAIEQQIQAGNFWLGQAFNQEGLETIVEERPDMVASWISSADPTTREGLRLIFKASSFYDALCAVLLKKEQHLGIKLYNQLKQASTRIRIIDRFTQIELLDFTLFDSEPSPELKNCWDQKVEMCSTDEEMMKIALVAQHGSGKDWLWNYIESRIQSSIPIEKARSRFLLGFFDSEDASSLIEELQDSDPPTWLRDSVNRSKMRQQQNEWAKYWFREFLTATDDVSAWASMRLLLRCCDRRFWFWRHVIETDVNLTQVDSRRNAFLRDNLDKVKNAIKENEKQLTEQFIGQKILKRQVYPWM